MEKKVRKEGEREREKGENVRKKRGKEGTEKKRDEIHLFFLVCERAPWPAVQLPPHLLPLTTMRREGGTREGREGREGGGGLTLY